MAKRFTDTDKWKRPWFRKLPIEAKFVWFYILDNCDHAGVWIADFELLSFQVGYEVTEEKFVSWFGDKVVAFDGDKFFIPSFVEFQYGELNPANNAHKAIIKILEKLGASQPLMSPSQGAQDKDKDKDKDKEEGGYGGKQPDPPKKPERPKPTLVAHSAFDFEAAYKKYPVKLGKADGRVEFNRQIKTQSDYDDLVRAIERFNEHNEKNKQDPKYIQHFDTFMRPPRAGAVPRWRDWLDPETGTAANFAQAESGSLGIEALLAAEAEAKDRAEARLGGVA